MDYLPKWIVDVASISSIIGLLITIFLLLEARKIRNSFLRRARLPEVTKEISASHKKLAQCLKDWTSEEKKGIEQLFITKELLRNLHPKLPSPEKKKISLFINTLKKKEWIIFSSTIKSLTEDEAWVYYQNISAMLTTLKQLEKDSRWN